MKFLNTFLFILFCSSVWAQTFNKRFDLSSPSCLFGSVVTTDSMYYLTGTKIDSSSPYFPHGFFAGIDLNGELTLLNFERDTQFIRYRGFPYLYKKNNSFIVGGKRQTSEGFVLLTNLDINGDIIWEKEFQSFFAVEENYHIGVEDLTMDENNSIYMLNGIVSTLGKNQKSIIKTDVSGDFIWHKPQGFSSENSIGGMISMANDGNIWLVYTVVDDDYSLPLFEYQTRIVKVDTTGNVLSSYITDLSQGQIGRIGGFVEAEDGA